MRDPVNIKAIRERYKCGRHLAEKIMNQLPHFYVGRTLFARAADLEEWERGRTVYPLPTGRRKTAEPFLIPRKRA